METIRVPNLEQLEQHLFWKVKWATEFNPWKHTLMVGAFNAFICSLTHILSALFSSTSVLFFCPPFGSYKATEVSSREVIIMKSLKDLTEISLSISPTKSSVFTTPGQLAITALAHICLKVWLTGYTNKAVPTYTVPHPIFNFVEGNRKQPLF